LNVDIDDFELHDGFWQTWLSSQSGEVNVWIGPSNGHPDVDIVRERYVRPPHLWEIHTYISLWDSTKRYTPFQNTETRFVELFDSIQVEKTMFSDGVLFHSRGGLHGNPPSEIIWAKGVGKIQQINMLGDHWELVDFYVAQ
jgi:hypothetical protein